MKKSQIARKVLKLLKNWENCQLEYRLAEEILDLVVTEGMEPPEWTTRYITRDAFGRQDFLLFHKGWEPETKRRRRKK